MGMAHRGRLNVLAHVLGRPYEPDPARVRGRAHARRLSAQPTGASGDVKYHLGARGTTQDALGRHHRRPRRQPEPPRGRRPGRRGLARAEQTDRSTRGASRPTVAVPILIHGDASFPGPGRCRRDAQPRRARRLLDRRNAPPDREQPGGLHDRSRRRALDPVLERPRQGLRRPDRPRQRRRSGGRHRGDPAGARLSAPVRRTTSSSTSSATGATATTRGDEPAYTQPLMAQRIKVASDRPRAAFAARLVDEGAVTEEEAEQPSRRREPDAARPTSS